MDKGNPDNVKLDLLSQDEIQHEVSKRDRGLCAKPDCQVKMAKLEYDPHSLCENCRGQPCSEDNKCHDCALWSTQQFKTFIRYQNKRKRDKEY